MAHVIGTREIDMGSEYPAVYQGTCWCGWRGPWVPTRDDALSLGAEHIMRRTSASESEVPR